MTYQQYSSQFRDDLDVIQVCCGNQLHAISHEVSDTRSHIVVELYDTEHSYVDSLQILVTKYLLPLKSRDCNNLIEPYVVEEIFYKIPEILSYHEIFLEELRIRLEGWNTSKCIGDIFLDTFTKPAVIDAYIGFITNWKAAKESIKQTCQMKPAFARFLEDMAREHKGKLALDSLLIMPVQRIPRYELLIQSLLKHTEICHPDYDKLQEALRQVHDLAIRINCTERDTLELENIEKLIDGLHNLVAADRGFLRYDLVIMTSGQQMSRKERALFLFNDLLLITSMKRRSSTAKKPIPSNPNITNILESNKYKLLSKIPLEYLDIEKVRDENVRKMLQEIEFLKSDVNILSQIVELVATLHCPNEQMEDTLRDMQSALNKQLVDKQVSDSQLSHLELILTTRNNVEHLSIIFSTPEKRTNWEETFLEAKARLNVGDNRRLNPEFLTSVPVRKTRAGLQFTCAAASYNQHDVWVCNSDGYVGQVCILTMSPEPAVTSCNGVCNARISSVTCVPLSKSVEKYLDSPDTLGHVNPAVSLGKSEHFDDITESIPVENLEHSALDIQLKSSSSSDDDDDDDLIDEHKDADASPSEIIVESTMWLGTEDGVVHIYNCADSLRVKRNRLKIQHNFAVFCILYVDKSVFVSLANGDVYVYYWTTNFGWNITEPTILTVGCVTTPVTRMFLACGKLWCICQNIIKIVNVHTLHIENSFSVIGENNRAITSVAVSGFSVYLSLQNSAVLRLVHGVTYDILAEINVAPAVTKMLSGTDDIIRQHKAACLRVTSLLACKELLWIGTSAGVILTLTMPSVKENTTKIPSVPHPVGLPHGHTGHVRFLTLVKCQTKAKAENGRRIGKTTESKADTNKMLVISGGDGYEDFRSSSVSEIAGREDSTNHLLIWRS